MGKFIRRHRVGTTVAATFIAMLLAFAAMTTIQGTASCANAEAQIARAVNEFLQNDLLAQASATAEPRPDIKPDPDLKVRTALDRAAASIDRRFAGQPLIAASIRATIGKAYQDLGLYRESERHLARAFELRRRELGEEDPSNLSSMHDPGQASPGAARYEQADQLTARALDISQRVLGEEHPTLAARLRSDRPTKSRDPDWQLCCSGSGRSASGAAVLALGKGRKGRRMGQESRRIEAAARVTR